MHYQLGLIGWPLEYSLSPTLHNTALRALNLTGEYRLYPVPPLPDGARELASLVERVRRSELHGLNVTAPHKQAVLSLMDELTPTASAIGAVNTIYLRGDRLTGDNTDAPGFMTDLQRFLKVHSRHNLDPLAVALILGAGGSARAVAYALAHAGWKVYVAARRLKKAQALTIDLIPVPRADSADSVTIYQPITAISLDPTSLSHLNPDLVVNATPVGMQPNAESCPWPTNLDLPPGAAVYDLVYNPPETALVRRARETGLPATTGLGMLIEQATLSFQCWTGLSAPQEAMRDAVGMM